jgi:hypothetical protein
MLANDSPRAARRRAQVAAMALGSARLAAVQAEVLKALPPEAAGRVVIRAARAATSTGLPAGGRVIACTRRRVVR